MDGTARWTTISLWGERTFSGPGSRNEWFLSGGLGYATIDADAVSGALQGGGTFDIRTDAGDELVAFVGGGYRRHLGSRWALEGLIRYDHHFSDWDVVDLDTGATGSVDDYGMTVILLGVTFGL